MALTAQMFNQIMKGLKSDNGSRPNEQRTNPRVGVHGRADIRTLPFPPAGGRKVSVWVRDLSIDGVGILHSVALPEGTRFVLTYHQPGGKDLNVVYIVAHTAQVSKGLFGIGARVFGTGVKIDAA